jgi:hypothetical protein
MFSKTTKQLQLREQLSEASKGLYSGGSEADATRTCMGFQAGLPFPGETWTDQHLRLVMAASARRLDLRGHATMNSAIAYCPRQRFTIWNGTQAIRQHPRSSGKPTPVARHGDATSMQVECRRH